MSTSLLYHAWQLRGYRYIRTDYLDGAIYFTIAPKHEPQCPCCQSRDVIRRGEVERKLRCLPIGKRPVWIIVRVPRVTCRACGKTRRVEVTIAPPRRSFTRQFERYVLDLCKTMTMRDVAKHLGVGWDVVKDIQKRYLYQRFKKIKVGKLKRIAIDEISIGKGHQYFTVVLDLDTGAVVFIGKGKGGDALNPFWAKLRRSRAKIQAVATDMSPAYTQAVRLNLPNACHVFDRFHVIKLYNEKLSNLRRELQREAKDKLEKQVLKGTRWLLLKNPENLNEQRHEPSRLQEALRVNQPLAAAYYLKESLRQFWDMPDKASASAHLDAWLAMAERSGVGMLERFAATLRSHRPGLLAYFDHRITTAALEGTNTKIRVMQRQAYGYRDREFFKLKIHALHESRFELVG